MEVYRILKEPYWHDPLSVIGAELAGGRWNPPGVGILYTATSPALALLETVVHFPKVPYSQLPKLRVFALQIPDGEVRWIYPEVLPDAWGHPASLPITRAFLSEWLQHPADVGVGLPSAIMDISYNILLHPNHSLYQQIRPVWSYDLVLDHRLWPLP